MIQLIQAATFPKTNQERAAAEKALIEHRQSNPNQFFQQMADMFKSNEVPDKIRQAVGTIMAVSVLTKSKNGTYMWDLIEGNYKTNIKHSILEVLIDPDRSVRRAAANIVSTICFIQLPRKEWDGIVQKICVNISHDNQIVKEASILTLGFICSRMKEKSDFVFSAQIQQNIITGIVIGIQQTEPDIVETSLKALRDSISSLTEILKNQQYREFLLKQAGDIITSGKFTIEGLQILGEFVKCVYQSLCPYIGAFFPLLQPFVSNSKNEDVCVAAMEIWESVAAQTKEAPSNIPNVFSGELGMKVVTSLLKNLCVMDNEDLEGNAVSDSASKALETIFDLGSMEYKDLVLEFVGSSISQNDWRYRQASIKAFSLVLLGLPEQQNQILIKNSLAQLVGLLQDNSMVVQYATLQSFIIISQFCGEILLRSDSFVEYLKLIVSKVYVCQKFLKSGCKIIENMCEADRDNGLGKFNMIADDLISALLQLSLEKNSTPSMINWAISAMMGVIEVTNNDQVCQKYIAYILDNFQNIGKIGDSEKRDLLASAFFTIAQYCLHSLKKSPQIDMAVLTAIYDKVIGYFKAKSEVSADGLYAIEALVPYFMGDVRLVDDFWVYIQHSLAKWEDPTLFRATIICISSLLASYTEYLAPKLETFVPQLIELLKNPSFNRQMKIDCLLCLGEMFLNAPQASLKFLPPIIQVIMICCNAAIGMTETDFNYSEILKDSILECLMCIVHGINGKDSKMGANLNQYIQDFFHFILVSLEPKHQPSIDYFNRAILLMADMAKYYSPVVGPFKKDPALINAINTFKGVTKSQKHTQTISYAQQQLQ